MLYRGARLAQAVEWREHNEAELNALEREFLDASSALKQGLEQQEKERKQRELDAALAAEKEDPRDRQPGERFSRTLLARGWQ